MRFSQRLKELRKELHLRQNDLAAACGVKLTAISKYENELVKPAFEMLAKIGLAYNVNLNWLVNEIGTMFIETPQRRLIKTGTDNFEVEETTNITLEDKHSMNLEKDVKVEYYGANNETFTKIYHKNGDVEYQSGSNTALNFQNIAYKIAEISQDESKYEFVMTAINALNDEKALTELETLVRGMKLGKK